MEQDETKMVQLDAKTTIEAQRLLIFGNVRRCDALMHSIVNRLQGPHTDQSLQQIRSSIKVAIDLLQRLYDETDPIEQGDVIES